MATLIGISNLSDAGASILSNGPVIAAVNEERLNRIKLYGGIPTKSVEEVLRLYKGKRIDAVALSGQTYGLPDIFEYSKRIFDTSPKYYKHLAGRFKHVLHYRTKRSKKLKAYAKKRFPRARIFEIDHHLSHAASAHYTSGQKNNIIITMDAWGDRLSNGAYLGKDSIELIYSTPELYSLGYFYGRTTTALGFKYHRHEGKVTGLAAYGKVQQPLLNTMRKMISFDRKKMSFKAKIGKYYLPSGTAPGLEIFFSKYKKEDVAATAQLHLEEVTKEYIIEIIDKLGKNNLALAGGVFANVKLNQAIKNINGVKSIFIHPHMGDGGLGMGAALWVHNQEFEPMNIKLKDVYFGPSYASKQIKEELDKHHLDYKYLKDIESEVAELLAKGKVVARFDGRMEYGPRALGNRSILYQTTDKSVNDWLNQKLHRCYDDKTEVLTSKGWKCIKDLSEMEKVATLNPDKNTLEFQKIKKKVSYPYQGEMYRLKNKRMDLLITPNHNMWIRKKHSTKFEFTKIDDVAKIKTYHYQKKGGVKWNGIKKEFFILPAIKLWNKKIKNIKIPMNVWLEFLGYFLSEGYTYNDGYGHYISGIGQSKNSRYFHDIEKCLKKIPFNFNYDRKQFVIRSKQLYLYLKKFGKAKDKYIPEEIKKLSLEQLTILFASLMKGDGNIRGQGYRYATTSKKLADDVQEISLKIGLTAFVSIQKKSENPAHNLLYMVRIGKSSVSTVRSHQINKEKYDGKVYCVTVPNHILYVRRNGKGVFCGNTEFMPFAPATLIEHTRKSYIDYEGAEYAARFMTITFDCTDWMKKTCPGVVHLDGTARPQLVDKQSNPGYYRIIDEYRKITGIPSIINTSFNMHEEPIVCTPYDSIRAFTLGHLDYLAIGNYLVKGKMSKISTSI